MIPTLLFTVTAVICAVSAGLFAATGNPWLLGLAVLNGLYALACLGPVNDEWRN
jgi:hypothetical protein